MFLGAGISKDAKIPTWDNLVSDLLVSLMSNKLSDYEINLTENQEKFIVQNLKTMNGESPLLQARYIRSGLEDVFLDLTNEILYKNCINSSSLLEEISRLCLPVRNGTGVRSVVTYNFDDLLEYNFEKLGIKYRSIYRESDIPTKNELGIYHVHGFLPRNREDYENISESLLVFSEEEYHNLMLDSYNWSNLIQLNYLRENTCLMIGLSVTDPNLRRLLDIAMRKQEDSDLCKHYVILKMKSISEKAKKKGDLDVDNIEKFDLVNRKLQEEFFKELGLNVIWVEEHKEIPEIIAKIYG
ncbi:SIR2 family protein [Halanaerobium salsuginis]|uniref:SIR2-like domain-containing protein n=1 Tax=Halanaerobium salsuginis TaxID=29563 RepID=A0A1I4MP64_9FIRM|nr:SIR2 family protein [Halanaerobium salsuginis]SFM04900.1 SIR2-like domain-containing protein [Halanaerobium salsuginis]